jgi:hypothetical protein
MTRTADVARRRVQRAVEPHTQDTLIADLDRCDGPHEQAGIRKEAPQRLTDGAEPTYKAWDAGEGDPDDPVDRPTAATRRAVFPKHGLDPLDPR